MTVLTRDVTVGVQIIVEGEKLEVEQLIILMQQFLELAIPALTTIQATILFIVGIFNQASAFWNALMDILPVIEVGPPTINSTIGIFLFGAFINLGLNIYERKMETKLGTYSLTRNSLSNMR